jgi:hypothetical protein
VKSLNLGVNRSKNLWIARFDADDSYSPLRLQEQRSGLQPGVAVVFSDYMFLSASNLRLGTVYSAIYPNPTAISLVASQRTAHPSAVINRDKLLQAGGYLEEDFPAEDLSLWLRLSRLGYIKSVPEVLLKYRLNPLGITSTQRHNMLIKKESLLQTIKVNPIDVERLCTEALEISAMYTNHTYASSRRILLAKDMVAISRRYKNGREMEITASRILSSELFSNQGLKAFYELSLQKYRRRRLR